MTERVSRSNRLALVDRTDDGPPNGPADGDEGQPPAPRYPGWLRAGRIVALVAAVTLFVGTAASWGTQAWLSGKLHSVDALDPNATTVIDLAGQAGAQNYLLVGTDPSAAAPALAPGAPPPLPDQPPLPPQLAPHGGSVRPDGPVDTIMLVHVPNKANRAIVLSLPANLAVDRPSCDRWDPVGGGYPGGTSPAQPGVSLAAAYTLGGPRCLTKAVQQLTGVSVNHYTGLDVTGLAAVVDSVRGVPVCLAGSGSPAPGPTVLGGSQAVDFVGESPTAAGLAGGGQVQRQQLFVAALLRKATSDQVLLHPGELRGFVTAFGDHSRSANAGLGELATLAHSLQSLDPSKIFLATVPTAGGPDAQGNQAPAADPAKALFDAIRGDQTLPGESAAAAGPSVDDSNEVQPAGATDTLPPSAVTLNVRNGSARSGLANQAADLLRPLGFTIAAVGDAPPSDGGRTVIRHSADRGDQAAALANAVPSAVSETVPGTTGLLDLVLGDSFDGQVRAAPVTATGDPATGGLRTLSAVSGSCP
jgi:LCP family protein required for cell wall assembly